jgi:3-oxoacyl-[acyl-carrier protein] reductase
MDDATLHGKTVVVTGAAIGIGYAICERCLNASAKVVLNDVDEYAAQRAVDTLAQRYPSANIGVYVGSAAEPSVIEGLLDTAKTTFGSVDVVVANAGITLFKPFLETSLAEFDKVVNVNLRGSYALAQAAARLMKAQGTGGRIILMSSCVGKLAIEGLSVYSMTKAGLRMLARSLALELGQYGVTVNAIAPGATLTERTAQELPDYAGSWGGLLPTKQVGTPEDIAEAALFLASPAAKQISGITLEVDGGWSSLGSKPSG